MFIITSSMSFELMVLVGDTLALINCVNEFSLGRSAAATRLRILNLCIIMPTRITETTKTAKGTEI